VELGSEPQPDLGIERGGPYPGRRSRCRQGSPEAPGWSTAASRGYPTAHTNPRRGCDTSDGGLRGSGRDWGRDAVITPQHPRAASKRRFGSSATSIIGQRVSWYQTVRVVRSRDQLPENDPEQVCVGAVQPPWRRLSPGLGAGVISPGAQSRLLTRPHVPLEVQL